MIRKAVEEIMAELGIGGQHFEIETAMGAPNSESVQIRIFDQSGDGKAVVVDLADKDGKAMDWDQKKERIRKQLETFRNVTEL